VLERLIDLSLQKKWPTRKMLKMRDSLIKKKIPHFCSLEDTIYGYNMEETNFWTKNEETDNNGEYKKKILKRNM